MHRTQSTAILLVALTACGRIGFDAVTATTVDGAATDTDSDFDSDGDGVPDSMDNCPTVPNPTQDNEDGDRFGDACDPCPPYPDPDPVIDSDGDGVSDMCDPHPATPGDSIVMFDGFDIGLPSGALVNGNWSIANGIAVVTGALNTFATVTFAPPTGSAETIATHMTLDNLIGSSGRGGGVVHQWDQATSGGAACVVALDDSSAPVYAIVDDATNNVLTSDSVAVADGTAASLVSTRTGQSYHCVSTIDTMALDATDSYTSPTPQIGIYTRSATAHFDWMMIIATQ